MMELARARSRTRLCTSPSDVAAGTGSPVEAAGSEMQDFADEHASAGNAPIEDDMSETHDIDIFELENGGVRAAPGHQGWQDYCDVAATKTSAGISPSPTDPTELEDEVQTLPATGVTAAPDKQRMAVASTISLAPISDAAATEPHARGQKRMIDGRRMDVSPASLNVAAVEVVDLEAPSVSAAASSNVDGAPKRRIVHIAEQGKFDIVGPQPRPIAHEPLPKLLQTLFKFKTRDLAMLGDANELGLLGGWPGSAGVTLWTMFGRYTGVYADSRVKLTAGSAFFERNTGSPYDWHPFRTAHVRSDVNPVVVVHYRIIAIESHYITI